MKIDKQLLEKIKGSKIVSSAKENPIGTAALGIATANLMTNNGRRRQDKKYHKEQSEFYP